ncbi:MAG: ribonuclease D [Caldilineales bacterium]|nr:ribonuclease D [Caldilineales bacterium]MDW8317774.1 ribonuclease D [Anaerolineae bacterium]
MSPARHALSPPILVEDAAGLAALLEQSRRALAVAVDTEANSLYAYYPRVCLIQLSLPGADFIVDPLAVDPAPLADLFADPALRKIFHAAENDILGLKRDFGFRFANLFDTMLAARILGWREVGLSSILVRHFGVKLDKRMQRTDWGQRPLRPEQLSYAQLDTHFLIPLAALQEEELRRRGRWAEAAEAFARLPDLEAVPKAFDAENFRRIGGARDLTPRQQAVLRELYIFREEEARRLDRPPFKLFSEALLVALATEQPTTLEQLARTPGVTEQVLRHWGQGLLAAIERGRRASPPRPPAREGNGSGRPDPQTQARYEALRRWRAAQAAARGVDVDVVLTNQTLMAIAQEAPRTVEELEALQLLGPAKLQEYGAEIVRALWPQRL